MTCAWRENDTVKELLAYEGMATQHYYTGNMKKCSFLFDRVMSGTIEESNLKHITISQMNKKEAEFLKRLTRRKDIHEWSVEEQQR